MNRLTAKTVQFPVNFLCIVQRIRKEGVLDFLMSIKRNLQIMLLHWAARAHFISSVFIFNLVSFSSWSKEVRGGCSAPSV